MRHSVLFVVVAATAIMATACNKRDVEPKKGIVQEIPAAVDPSGMLTVKPGALDLCASPDKPVAVEVSWNAMAAKTEGVQVFLQNAGEERKLWSAAGAVGNDTTGAWMRDGARVTLMNAESGEQLAQITLKSVACNE